MKLDFWQERRGKIYLRAVEFNLWEGPEIAWQALIMAAKLIDSPYGEISCGFTEGAGYFCTVLRPEYYRPVYCVDPRDAMGRL